MFFCLPAWSLETIDTIWSLADSNYLTKLETCEPFQNLQKLQFGETEVNIYQEISGIKNDKCTFSLGIVEEYLLQCKLAQNDLKTIIAHLKDSSKFDAEYLNIINNPQYCFIEGVSPPSLFKDKYGVEFNCNEVMNVQMVSDEECQKCRNRTLIEDTNVNMGDSPLTYCVLKYCPVGYLRNQNGRCVKQ